MKKYLLLEFYKIRNIKWVLLLLGVTTILLPIVTRILANLNFTSGQTAEGQYLDHAAFGIISFSTLYLFLPVWILIVVGMEFTNGHTTLVIFHQSRWFYFCSKIVYCLMISGYFSLLALVSVFIIQATAPVDIPVYGTFFLEFFIQAFVTFFSHSVFLLAIIFFTRSPILGFVVYFFITFCEQMVYKIMIKIYGIDLFYLPRHLLNSFYVKSGEQETENYYNPFTDFDPTVILLPFMVFFLLYVTWQGFIRRDSKPLSD